MSLTVTNVTAQNPVQAFGSISDGTPLLPAQEEEHAVLAEAVEQAKGAWPPICS